MLSCFLVLQTMTTAAGGLPLHLILMMKLTQLPSHALGVIQLKSKSTEMFTEALKSVVISSLQKALDTVPAWETCTRELYQGGVSVELSQHLKMRSITAQNANGSGSRTVTPRRSTLYVSVAVEACWSYKRQRPPSQALHSLNYSFTFVCCSRAAVLS